MLCHFTSLILLASSCLASPLSPKDANAGAASVDASAKGKPTSEESTTFDGVPLANIQAAPAPEEEVVTMAAIGQAGWTIVASSQQGSNPATSAIDGSTTTFWHSEYSPTLRALPHTVTVDMKAVALVGSISCLPRQDGSSNGRIGQHTIQLSTDGTNFVTVARGTWADDSSLKRTTFTPTNGRWVRIIAETEAGNRGPWASIAEINVDTATGPAPPNPAGKGSWGLTIDVPLVPVSAALQWNNGRLLLWSSYSPSTFGGSPGTTTVTATYDPATQTVSRPVTVTNINHDMFCEGLSIDFNGRFISTGGNTISANSIFDPAANSWARKTYVAPLTSLIQPMRIPRGYQSQTTTSSGNVFVIGASWSGGQGGKNGELYTTAADTWALLSGAPVAPMLTADAQGVYRADNHGWLFAWSANYVFQAGPSRAMNWYGTTGTGSQTAAGTRNSDPDSMCGNAVMYDSVGGKILTVGGSPDYQNSDGSSNANVITLGAPPNRPSVTTIGNMAYRRVFHNSVVLPDGTVFITGGQVTANPFSDATAVLTPELFNPATNGFTQLAPMAIPRTYHSVALLLFDGTVMNGGGGLCGNCATNHFDFQIFRPPYLYTSSGALATRPVINSVSVGSIRVGGTFTVTTNVACNSFSIVRLGSTTHTVNTDQRRIGLTPRSTSGTTYTFTLPTDAGVALPGYWMVYAMNGGVPSVSKTLKITLT